MKRLLKLIYLLTVVLSITACQGTSSKVDERLTSVEMTSKICDSMINAPHEKYVIYANTVKKYYVLSEDTFYSSSSLSEESTRAIDEQVTIEGICQIKIASGFVTSIENVFPKCGGPFQSPCPPAPPNICGSNWGACP